MNCLLDGGAYGSTSSANEDGQKSGVNEQIEEWDSINSLF